MRHWALVFIFLVCSNLSVTSLFPMEIVEDVLATVGVTPVLYSDLVLAEAVQLVEIEDGETQAAFRSRLLGLRIQLELQFRDLEATGALHRMEFDLNESLIRLSAPSGGRESLERLLAPHGLTWADVEDLALRLQATQMWVEMRLRPRITVNMGELEQAYQSEVVAPLTLSEDPIPDFSSVRTELHRLLVERKLNDEIEAWIAEAAERQEITRFQR